MKEQKAHKKGLKTTAAVAIFAVVAAVVLVLDRATKAWAIASIPQEGLDFIPGLIGFRLVFNRGASFGMLQGATVVFLVISVVICVALLVYLVRYKRHLAFEAAALGLVFAGALGNAYDRLAYGQVTDFLNLEFMSFPIFNVADCGITVGVVLLVIFMVFSKNSPFAAEKPAGAHAAEGGGARGE